MKEWTSCHGVEVTSSFVASVDNARLITSVPLANPTSLRIITFLAWKAMLEAAFSKLHANEDRGSYRMKAQRIVGSS